MNSKFFGAAALVAISLGAAPALATDVEPLTGNALILKPLQLTKQSDLSFGSIIPSGQGDLVTINADSGLRSSPSAGLILTDPGYRARFASSGLNNQFVVLQLSPPGDLTSAAGDKLTVTRLDLDQGGNPLRILTPTSQVFFVGIGGQVFVRADQEEGVYDGEFSLIANYL